MARIYTRTGDKGETGLIGGERLPKSSARMCAIGDVDELNAQIGVARSFKPWHELDVLLYEVQNRLFDLGSGLAVKELGKYKTPQISEEDVKLLENSIDEAEATVEPLRNFILPGGSPLAAQLHLARTVCRRAERSVLRLGAESDLPPLAIIYLNRLSDLLFVLARSANSRSGVQEVIWNPEDK